MPKIAVSRHNWLRLTKDPYVADEATPDKATPGAHLIKGTCEFVVSMCTGNNNNAHAELSDHANWKLPSVITTS